jgi:RES domain-containing protein
VAWHRTRDESLRRFGDDWIRAGESVALLVPSAAITGEWNVLLNPAHLDISRIELRDAQSFTFDTRMFR